MQGLRIQDLSFKLRGGVVGVQPSQAPKFKDQKIIGKSRVQLAWGKIFSSTTIMSKKSTSLANYRMKLHKTLQSHKLLTTLGFVKAVCAQSPLLVPGSAVIVVVVVCAKRGGCLSTWKSGRTSYVQPSSSRPTGRPRGHCFFFLFWQGPL